MKKESLILHESDYKSRAQKLAMKRNEWEKEQLKKGKKLVRVPHPTLSRTLIIKFE
jgi:hypothetical protein